MGLQSARVSTWSPVCWTFCVCESASLLFNLRFWHIRAKAESQVQKRTTPPSLLTRVHVSLYHVQASWTHTDVQGAKLLCNKVCVCWVTRASVRETCEERKQAEAWGGAAAEQCWARSERGLAEVSGQCGGTGDAIIYNQSPQWGDCLFWNFQIQRMMAAACAAHPEVESHGNNQSQFLFLHAGKQTISLSWSECVQISDLTGLNQARTRPLPASSIWLSFRCPLSRWTQVQHTWNEWKRLMRKQNLQYISKSRRLCQ